MADLEFFHPARIALNKEVVNHPELAELLANHPVNEFEIRLAEIAAYCDVALDGYYIQEQLDELCAILWSKLRAKGKVSIITSSSKLTYEELQDEATFKRSIKEND